MSRYPFKECVNKVMAAYEGNRAESTLTVMRRRFNRMEPEIMGLFEQGLISTTNPRNLTPEDVEQYFNFLRDKPGKNEGEKVALKSVKKDLIELDKLCKFEKNNCVDVFRARCPALTKGSCRDRLPVFTPKEIERIFDRCDQIDSSDVTLLRSFALLGLYFGAGLRTIELQNAEVDNIRFDGDRASIHLTVVKGKDSYGKPRDAFILPRLVPFIKRYLDWREEYLRSVHRECRYYFFSLDDCEMVSDNTIRVHRRCAEQDLGIEFDGRKCRRSYGQYLKDHGVEIEAISSLMGHNNTDTTEDYYARISPNMALDKAVNALFH